MPKPHYFDQTEADCDDRALGMAKMQGYVPKGCLLGGVVVMAEVTEGRKAVLGVRRPARAVRRHPEASPGIGA